MSNDDLDVLLIAFSEVQNVNKPYTKQDLINIVTLTLMQGDSALTSLGESMLLIISRKYFEGKGWSSHPNEFAAWGFYTDIVATYKSMTQPRFDSPTLDCE